MVIFTVTQVYPAHAVVPGSLPANAFCGTLQLENAGGMYVGPLGIVLGTIKKVLNPANSFLTQLREIEIP